MPLIVGESSLLGHLLRAGILCAGAHLIASCRVGLSILAPFWNLK
jgi:hypothetical protein